MSLTHNDIVKLLALVTAIDDIDITESKIEAWKAMAEEGDWPNFATARRALLVYRTENPDYPVRPGHITRVIADVRATADRDFNSRNNSPPRAVLDNPDPMAHHDWVVETHQAHRRAALARFARTTDPHQIPGSQP